MSVLGYIAVVALVLSVALIVEGTSALLADSGDDEQRADGIVTAGTGAVLLFGSSGVFVGIELG